MKRRQLFAFLSAALCVGLAVAAPSASEQAHIDRLIRHVELQDGLKFIRNGSEYSGSEAARFLRGKLQSMGQDVSTAREFIERIATKSSTSGKPYLIRLPDGKVTPSATYLSEQLKLIESPQK